MSNLEKYAQAELQAADLFSKGSDYDGMLGEAVMELIRQFAEQGHSGFSATMTVDLFNKLARFEPIRPLTGEDNEWNEFKQFKPGFYQNKRCSRVFKDSKDGQAYDIGGKVFKDANGLTYTSRNSRVPVVFPYWPKTKIVERKTK